jgi:predicted nucleic acid-binding protein
MKTAYVDTSCLAAVAFGEAGSARLVRSMQTYDVLLSSNLLEAELRAAVRRENADLDPSALLSPISWVYPDRPLTKEIQTVLEVGYVRGADLWHLAAALFVDPNREIEFITLDKRQAEIGRQLGFSVT